MLDTDPLDDNKEFTMGRPKIGIFGALMALGGFLAVRYVQRTVRAQVPAARELSRWEDEGGTVATPACAGRERDGGQRQPGHAGRRARRKWLDASERRRPAHGRFRVVERRCACVRRADVPL